MSPLKFITFEKILNSRIKDKLVKSLPLNCIDLKNLNHSFIECGYTYDHKSEVLKNIHHNLSLNENELYNLKVHFMHLKTREKFLNENINFYQNLQRYL